ncbi:MAG: polysaccharide biosynthesis protein [uncultured bacterium]|nr:MAG: polysaccharide biosynthesis protein [uncultured bacterium]
MIWSVLQMVSKQGLSFVVFGILSWLLSPADFGVLATAMIMISFLDSFSENGFSSALIQRQNVTNRHFSSIFVVNVLVGVTLTIIGISCAGLVADYFSTPLLKPVIQILSFGFVINTVSLTQLALAQKKLNFRALAIRDTISTAVSGGIGITLALLGFGVWSLVIQTICSSIINTIVLWSIADWRPNLKDFSLAAVKELWPYSSRLFVFNIIKFFAQNTEKFFISIMLGTVTLGIYSFAFKFTVTPITMFIGSIGVYLFPKFSELQADHKTVVKSYLLTTQVTQTIITPILVAIIIAAPIVVPAVWGNKWLEAIPILQILSILTYLQVLISPAGPIFKAFNRPNWLLYWSIGITLAVALSLPIAIHFFTLLGATWMITIVYLISLFVMYFMIRKLLPIHWLDLVRALWPSFSASGLAGLGFLVIVQLMPSLLWLQLICGLLVGGVIYFTILCWLDRNSIQLVIHELKRFTRPNPTA